METGSNHDGTAPAVEARSLPRRANFSRSLWAGSDTAVPALPPLAGDLSADVVVVGGGLAGAATALHLARAGREIVLIEDASPTISPATPASAGIVAPQLVRTTPGGVLKRLGTDIGGALLRSVAEAGRYTFGLIRDEKLDCAARPAGFLAPFPSLKQAEALRTVIAEWAPYRSDLELIGAREVERLSGCSGYAGALLDGSGGALDPFTYRRALLKRAREHGAFLVSGRVDRPVERHGDGYILHTPTGRLYARRVVLAANGGNPALWPKLARTILPLRVCEVATAPLPADLAAAILPQGHALTDLQTDIFTIRFDKDGRLITALPAADATSFEAVERAVNARLAAMLPTWRHRPLDHAWIGTAWLNSDLSPRLVQCDPGLIAVQACNGRGIALAAVVGREAARWADQPDYRPTLPMDRPKPIRGYVFARHVPDLVLATAAALRRVTGRGRTHAHS